MVPQQIFLYDSKFGDISATISFYTEVNPTRKVYSWSFCVHGIFMTN